MTESQLKKQKYFIEKYNSRIEKINEELQAWGMGKEKKISRTVQSKLKVIESCKDLCNVYDDLLISLGF